MSTICCYGLGEGCRGKEKKSNRPPAPRGARRTKTFTTEIPTPPHWPRPWQAALVASGSPQPLSCLDRGACSLDYLARGVAAPHEHHPQTPLPFAQLLRRRLLGWHVRWWGRGEEREKAPFAWPLTLPGVGRPRSRLTKNALLSVLLIRRFPLSPLTNHLRLRDIAFFLTQKVTALMTIPFSVRHSRGQTWGRRAFSFPFF